MIRVEVVMPQIVYIYNAGKDINETMYETKSVIYENKTISIPSTLPSASCLYRVISDWSDR